mgnify:FL=1
MLRLIVTIIAGIVIGSFINMAIITVGSQFIAAPAGVDVNDVDSIANAMHLYQPKHFLFPFLAHALGTFTGAFIAFRLSNRATIIAPLVVASFFLFGGIAMSLMVPASMWFIAVDLIFAYLPMAWLAIACQKSANS